jgi:hypothetical protein
VLVFVKFGSDYWLLRKTAISFAENWIKSPKIVITTKYFLFVILWLQTVDGSVPLLKIGVEKKTVNISGMNPSKQTNKQTKTRRSDTRTRAEQKHREAKISFLKTTVFKTEKK